MQRGDHLARGADRRVLKDSGASPAEGTLLDKSGNARYDWVWKRIQVDVRVGIFSRPAALAMIGCPEVGPDSVDPVQAKALSVVVKTEGVAATPQRRSSKHQSRDGEEVRPGSNISVSDYISKGNNEAPRPGVACTYRDRGPYSWTTGKNVPDAGSTLKQAGGSRAEDGRGKAQ